MTTSLYGPRLPINDYETLRHSMVDEQLHGIHDPRVLEAMRRVPRHLFVPEALREHAYADEALPLPYGQVLRAPRTIAAMLQAADLRGDERVLEVGVSSGYESALLAQLAGDVYALADVPELAAVAERNLHHLGLQGVHVVHGDAARGWPAAAPYAVILLPSATSNIPKTLLAQVEDDGRILFPTDVEPCDAVKIVARNCAGFEVKRLAIPASGRGA